MNKEPESAKRLALRIVPLAVIVLLIGYAIGNFFPVMEDSSPSVFPLLVKRIK